MVTWILVLLYTNNNYFDQQASASMTSIEFNGTNNYLVNQQACELFKDRMVKSNKLIKGHCLPTYEHVKPGKK